MSTPVKDPVVVLLFDDVQLSTVAADIPAHAANRFVRDYPDFRFEVMDRAEVSVA